LPSPASSAIIGADLAGLAGARGLEEHSTPLLALDLDALERNSSRMAEAFSKLPARLCPHVKHHKSTELARMQVAAGASGVTCSTTDEVAAMIGAGVPFALLANVITDRVRLRSLARSARLGDVIVAVDSDEAAELASQAMQAAGASAGALVELDIGQGRCGVRDRDEALRLADRVASLPGLRFRGIQAYEGHLVFVEDREKRRALAREAFAIVGEIAEALTLSGFEPELVTGGSTSTYDATGSLPFVTDVQAGTYLLMDTTYLRFTPEFEPALAVIGTTVTSRRSGEVVFDVGSKRVSTDLGTPALAGYEAEAPMGLSEEHGTYQLTGPHRPSPGERVAFIPAHTCTTMSMYPRVFGCRAGSLERIVEIDAR
jgi:D-serine deaminase-like pyridoxal phosphate-dependent protein